MSDSVEMEPPSTREAVLKVLESQRTRLERWKAARVREIELDGDRELAQLGQLVRILDSEPSQQRRAKKRKSPAALAFDRREAIARLLVESKEQLALGEISLRLRIPDFSTRRALKRLSEEGRVRRLGRGNGTRYEARTPGCAKAASPGTISDDTAEGTIGGRILMIVQDRASASLEELAQASGATPDEVRRICGGLIAEGEIQMGRRSGRSVYVARRAA